jgi:hypothetical protein
MHARQAFIGGIRVVVDVSRGWLASGMIANTHGAVMARHVALL